MSRQRALEIERQRRKMGETLRGDSRTRSILRDLLAIPQFCDATLLDDLEGAALGLLRGLESTRTKGDDFIEGQKATLNLIATALKPPPMPSRESLKQDLMLELRDFWPSLVAEAKFLAARWKTELREEWNADERILDPSTAPISREQLEEGTHLTAQGRLGGRYRSLVEQWLSGEVSANQLTQLRSYRAHPRHISHHILIPLMWTEGEAGYGRFAARTSEWPTLTRDLGRRLDRVRNDPVDYLVTCRALAGVGETERLAREFLGTKLRQAPQAFHVLLYSASVVCSEEPGDPWLVRRCLAKMIGLSEDIGRYRRRDQLPVDNLMRLLIEVHDLCCKTKLDHHLIYSLAHSMRAQAAPLLELLPSEAESMIEDLRRAFPGPDDTEYLY